MPFINVSGIDFFYQEAGEGHPLLLIHGAAGNADVWTTVFASLARDNRVIAYDRRAHTRTKADPPPTTETFSIHGEDAAGLLQALGAVPATVVGWSSGGLMALHLASRHPDLVSSLVLEEAPFLIFTNLTPEVASILQEVRRLADEGRDRDAAEVFLRFAGSYPTGGTAFDKLDPALRESMLENTPTVLTELQAGTGEELTVEQLQRIRCPVTCLLGELSPQVFPEATERLTRILPKAGVTRIPGAGHAVHIDQPELFIDAVRSSILTRL